MAKTKGKAAVPNWKKKKWYELIAPQIYGEKVLGETLAESPDHVKGKVVTVNMMNLLGNPRKQNISVKLRVEKVEGNKGLTRPIKLSMSHVSVKRLIRSGKDRVDESFTAKTKAGMLVRAKPLIITKSITSNSTKTALRAKAKEFLTEYFASHTLDAIFDAITRGNLQKEMKDLLEKIYPLRMVEMRVIEVELEKGERVILAEDSSSSKSTSEPKEETSSSDSKEEETEEESDSKNKE